MESTLEDVPDSQANTEHFGRLTSGKSPSPFQEVRCLYLAEAGTHAIVDAVLARCKASEQALAWVILRSIQLGMLVMTDRNFIAVKWLTAVQQRGAQVLCRLAAGCFTQRSRTLSDGSSLVTLRAKGQAPLILRVTRVSLAACGGARAGSFAGLAHLFTG